MFPASLPGFQLFYLFGGCYGRRNVTSTTSNYIVLVDVLGMSITFHQKCLTIMNEPDHVLQSFGTRGN